MSADTNNCGAVNATATATPGDATTNTAGVTFGTATTIELTTTLDTCTPFHECMP